MKKQNKDLPQFIQFLNSYLAEQRQTDPKFSLNRFAKQMEINPGILHALLSGERKLTIEMAENLGQKLGLSGEKIHHLGMDIIFEEHTEVDTGEEEINIMLIAANSLVKFKRLNITPAWIAESLNIKIDEANSLLLGLKKMNIIEPDELQGYRIMEQSIPTTWKMAPRVEISKQAHKHVHDHQQNDLINSSPEIRPNINRPKTSMLSENFVFFVSPSVLEKNRALVASAFTNLVKALSEESKTAADAPEAYFCFSQFVPCKKASGS